MIKSILATDEFKIEDEIRVDIVPVDGKYIMANNKPKLLVACLYRNDVLEDADKYEFIWYKLEKKEDRFIDTWGNPQECGRGQTYIARPTNNTYYRYEVNVELKEN